MKYAVGIDVGGNNTRVALINEEYKILERIKFSTDSKDPEVTLQKIGEIIKGFAKEIEGIGISCHYRRRVQKNFLAFRFYVGI